MDLSKLPKLSQTPAPPTLRSPTPVESEEPQGTALPATATRSAPCRACGAAVSEGQQFCGICGGDSQLPAYAQPVKLAEAWSGIGIGVILLVISPRIFQYLRLHGTPGEFEKIWAFSDKTGVPLAYTKSAFFQVDLALALFAGVLILDGIALLLSQKKWVVLSTFVATIIAILVNGYALASTYGEIGFQLFPVIAIAIGGYFAMLQWATYRGIRAI